MEAENPIYIYYHMDFDGVVSAVMADKFLKNKGYSPAAAEPVDYDLGGQWAGRQKQVKTPFAVVDFAYRDDCAYFFDHHRNGSIKEDNERIHFDPEAKSCASILYELIKNNPNGKTDARKLEELVRWCNIIDSAEYPENNISVKEVLYPKEPAVILSRSMEQARTNHDSAYYTSIVNALIGDLCLGKICERGEVKAKFEESMRKQEQAMKLMSQRAFYNPESGIIRYDVADGDWSRYGLAHLFPESLIWMGLRTTKPGFTDISASKNPWNKNCEKALRDVHIGEILKGACGHGGGHKGVGAVTFSSYEDARGYLNIVVKAVRERMIIEKRRISDGE